MKIQLDMTKAEHLPMMDMRFSSEYKYPQPSAGTDGASFPAIPSAGVFAIPSTIGPFGTSSFPGSPESHRTSAPPTERYAQLKRDIVASGVPLLDDEELRDEIRDPKGVKSEPED